MNDARAQAKVKLAEVVKRVMADGKIDASEREEMKSVYSLLTAVRHQGGVDGLPRRRTGRGAGGRHSVRRGARPLPRRPRRAQASAGARARGLSSAALTRPRRAAWTSL